MSVGVSHGADTGRLRRVAEDLSVSAEQLLQVEQSGTASMGVLLEAWAGPDTESLAGDWQSAGPLLTTAAERLSNLARLLQEQAEQQDRASGGSGQGASGGAAGAAGRNSAGGPDVVDAVRNALSGTGPRGGWAPDLSAVSRPRGTGPGELTWWAVDEATDWASDVYVDHVRANPFSSVPLVEKGLKESSDWVRDLQTEYLKKKTNPSPVDGPSFLLGIVADELDMYSKILHDPKGWWDNDASTLDKVGLGLSAVPGLGLLGKAVVKSTKEVFDAVAAGLRHTDDVKTPHVPHTPKSDTIDPHSGPDAHDNGNPNKGGQSDVPGSTNADGSGPDAHDDGNPNTGSDDGQLDAEPDDHSAMQPSGGRGQWEDVNENMSERAAKYQEQITGQPITRGYVVTLDDGRKVKFDGLEGLDHLDAKGPGYKNFVNKEGEYYDWWKGQNALVNQARRQVEAADGDPVVWPFAEPEAAEATEELFARRRVDGIIIKVVPVEEG